MDYYIYIKKSLKNAVFNLYLETIETDVRDMFSEVPFGNRQNDTLIAYTDYSIKLNSFTTTNSKLYNKSNDNIKIYNQDITECIWPKFVANSNNWVANLPDFILDSKLQVKIGSNINSNITITPFEHSRNERFVSIS